MSQLPVRWSDTFRAITNVLMDGSTIVSPDAGATGVSWSMALAGLNEAELTTLENFFFTAQGALNPFTMLDPADNLLAYSQDFKQACWVNDPLLTVTPGSGDPFGGTTAAVLTNSAEAAQSLTQQINGPGDYQYCFSVYLTSAKAETVVLSQTGAGAPLQATAKTGTAWSRFVVTGATGTGDGVSFGVTLAPGAQVTIACAQVEPQPGAGPYKATTLCGGVYQDCRFDQDQLNFTATGPNQYGCALRIRSSVPTPWQP